MERDAYECKCKCVLDVQTHDDLLGNVQSSKNDKNMFKEFPYLFFSLFTMCFLPIIPSSSLNGFNENFRHDWMRWKNWKIRLFSIFFHFLVLIEFSSIISLKLNRILECMNQVERIVRMKKKNDRIFMAAISQDYSLNFDCVDEKLLIYFTKGFSYSHETLSFSSAVVVCWHPQSR